MGSSDQTGEDPTVLWPIGGLWGLQNVKGPEGLGKSTVRQAPAGSELPGFQLPPGPRPGQTKADGQNQPLSQGGLIVCKNKGGR